jgi:hypothetical protein
MRGDRDEKFGGAGPSKTEVDSDYHQTLNTAGLLQAWKRGDHIAAARLALDGAETCRRLGAKFGGEGRRWERDARLLEKCACRDAESAFKAGRRLGDDANARTLEKIIIERQSVAASQT